MTEYVYKLKNGKVISAYADEKGNISITKETLEIMANSWNDGYQKGRADVIEEVKRQMISLHTDMIFRYGADIVESRCDAFDELKEWLKEQNNGKSNEM